MSNIIDRTYFEKGNLYIPRVVEITPTSGEEATPSDTLDLFISKCERDLLLKALGVTLYEELIASFDESNNQVAGKWKDLVEGKTYTDVNGVKRIWEGLRGYDKQSLVAFYVFKEYLRDDEINYTATGTVKPDSKNATNFSPTPKFIKAEIEFIKMYQGNRNNTPNIVVNGFGSVGFDWYGISSPQVSLYTYLVDQNDLDASSFPDFEFTFYRQLTSLGI